MSYTAVTYTPATYAVGTVQPIYLTTPPAGFIPQPLPTSAGYVRPPKQKKSFTAGIRDAWDKMTTKAQSTWNEQTDDRFRKYFGHPYSEQLFGEFWGEVWSGGQLCPCSVYLSTNWLSVEAKLKDSVTRNKMTLKAQIMLRDIIRVQRAVSLPSMRGGPPVIQQVTDPSVRADSVQIYTRDGMLHQFGRFYNYDKFIATLEYLWHLSTQPLASQGQQAAQAGGYQSFSGVGPNTVPLHQTPLTKEYEPVQVQPTQPTSGTPFR